MPLHAAHQRAAVANDANRYTQFNAIPNPSVLGGRIGSAAGEFQDPTHCRLSGGEGGIRTPDTLSGMPVFKTGAINHSATSPLLQFYYSLNSMAGGHECELPLWVPKAARNVKPTHRRKRNEWGTRYFVPLGYTSILLASPVFRRAIALEKSFIEMRSVITGCRSRRPLFSRAVIWYEV